MCSRGRGTVQYAPAWRTRSPRRGLHRQSREARVMGLFDKVKGQFIDIVEWLDDSRDTLV